MTVGMKNKRPASAILASALPAMDPGKAQAPRDFVAPARKAPARGDAVRRAQPSASWFRMKSRGMSGPQR